jgi:SHOCT-like domain
MTTSTDERNRILNMIESGQITAAQAAQLLDTLVPEPEQPERQMQNRTVRIWMTDMTTNRRNMNVTATMPVYLISMSLRLLARLVSQVSQLNDGTIQNVIRAIEKGTTGRLLDLQDLEEGKRLEIYVEK